MKLRSVEGFMAVDLLVNHAEGDVRWTGWNLEIRRQSALIAVRHRCIDRTLMFLFLVAFFEREAHLDLGLESKVLS